MLRSEQQEPRHLPLQTERVDGKPAAPRGARSWTSASVTMSRDRLSPSAGSTNDPSTESVGPRNDESPSHRWAGPPAAVILVGILSACGGASEPLAPSENSSVGSTAPLPELASPTPPRPEPSYSASSGGPDAEAPKRESAKRYSINFGSPLIPGSGSSDEPKTRTYRNIYPYTETIEILVPQPQWEIYGNTCETLAPGATCAFSLRFHPSTQLPQNEADIWAGLATICSDKKAAPCSHLPLEAAPTKRAPVVAVWKDWIGRLASHPPDAEPFSISPSDGGTGSTTPSEPTPGTEDGEPQPPVPSTDGT